MISPKWVLWGIWVRDLITILIWQYTLLDHAVLLSSDCTALSTTENTFQWLQLRLLCNLSLVAQSTTAGFPAILINELDFADYSLRTPSPTNFLLILLYFVFAQSKCGSTLYYPRMRRHCCLSIDALFDLKVWHIWASFTPTSICIPVYGSCL